MNTTEIAFLVFSGIVLGFFIGFFCKKTFSKAMEKDLAEMKQKWDDFYDAEIKKLEEAS